jgi:hypothetical protein
MNMHMCVLTDADVRSVAQQMRLMQLMLKGKMQLDKAKEVILQYIYIYKYINICIYIFHIHIHFSNICIYILTLFLFILFLFNST